MVFSMDKDSDGRVNKADIKQIDQTYKLIKNLDTK